MLNFIRSPTVPRAREIAVFVPNYPFFALPTSPPGPRRTRDPSTLELR